MKNLLIVLLVLVTTLACNNDKGMGGGNENGGGGNTRGNWSKADRNKWMQECTPLLAGNPAAQKICACVADKLEKKYPNADHNEKSNEEEVANFTRECTGAGGGGQEDDFGGNDYNDDNNNLNDNRGGGAAWTERDKKAIYNDCMSEVENTKENRDYCNCFTQKAVKKYRTPAEAARFTMEEAQQMAQECMGGRRSGQDEDEY